MRGERVPLRQAGRKERVLVRTVTCESFPSQHALGFERISSREGPFRSGLQIVPREIPKCLHVRPSVASPSSSASASASVRVSCPLSGGGYGAVLDRPPRKRAGERARTGSEMLAIFQSRFCGKTRVAATGRSVGRDGRLANARALTHTPMREEREREREGGRGRGARERTGLRD